jgi:hypothetical protein
VLVKAPVPCFVSVTLTINKASGDPDPDINAIKSAVVSEINNVDFQGVLAGSTIIDTVHNYLQGRLMVTDLDLLGKIREPNGNIRYIRSSDALLIPDLPGKMVTSKTVQFFTEVADISVNVVSSITVAV